MNTDQTSAMGSNYTDPAAGPQKARRASAGAAQGKEERYHRMSAALPIELKDEFNRRLAELGLNSLGELARMFAEGEGVIEAMRPLVREHLQREANRQRIAAGAVSVQVLRQMSEEDLQHFISTVRTGSGDD